jgi:hypothetical protein
VVDDHRQLRVEADPQRLGDRLLHAEAFAAHVRHVDAVMPCGHARQRDQLLGAGKRARRIDQCAREAQRPGAHPAVDELLHAPHLVGRRRTIVEPDHFAPRKRSRHQRAEVDRDAPVLETVEIPVKGGPVHPQAEPAEGVAIHRSFRPERRAGRLADDFRGDALTDVALAVAVG